MNVLRKEVTYMSDYKEIFERKEIKYLLEEKQFMELKRYLEGFARVDEYGLSRINNIYYDTPNFQLIRTSMEKPLYKEKIRLRTYGKTIDDTNAFIEIKKKYAGIVYKRRISGRYEQMHEYLTGGEDEIGDSQIAKEIRAFRDRYDTLIPAMSICYDRIAMTGINDKEFRVTFDTNIEWNEECADLRNIKKGKQLLKAGQYLMEIKVSNAMPIGLSRKMSELGIFPTSFSKYGAGYSEMVKERNHIKNATDDDIISYFRMKGAMAYA